MPVEVGNRYSSALVIAFAGLFGEELFAAVMTAGTYCGDSRCKGNR
jgi:hypothetical protein